MNSLRMTLAKFGQEHLLDFWEELSDEEKQLLYSDIASLDLQDLTDVFNRSMESSKNSGTKKDDRLEPFPEDKIAAVARSKPDQLDEWRSVGLKLISEGKVAVLLLAGGQGTRLGVDDPKGMYDVGLPSGKMLYQLQAERIKKLEELAEEKEGKGKITWYIMTSEYTREKTEEFFKRHGYFGLDPNNLVMFEQVMRPSMTFEGKLILDQKWKISRSPDGNGGLYRAVGENGILDDMKKRGVECMHIYCVDNILVKMADPVFVGYCYSRGAECGAKVVQKAFPTEAVGVVCKCDGKYQVVEYSEITIATAEKRNPDGRLTFSAGNICIHYLTVDFMEQLIKKHESQLKYHVVKKKIPYIDKSGQRISPDKPNGVKLEKFVFDVFEFASNFQLFEVLREDEFSPLKNGPDAGKDTPKTARSALMNLHYRYILQAGGQFKDSEGQVLPLIPLRRSNSVSNMEVECEISPLVSYAGEGLEETVRGKCYEAGIHLDVPGANSDGNGVTPVAKKTKLDGHV